ncbi:MULTISPECIES: PIN domain-containing protein [Nostocales]|uniref:Type II toxin-antitoxin system VapC family toxin n=2 Tax=Nostocales TaxID=1161 RepID=A0A8S9T2R3_9CYAN|nr:PIN domain-containing protein [Tolypothrix bouteillei]KAF3886645.1 type II toxin-antitoxin system VapC family toxin [Tolypothrix bouteillei VB521301]
MSYLLDTNMVSYILKKNDKLKKKLENVRSQGQEVFISCIAYYEVKRGLLYANATRQLSDLNELCRQYRVLFLDDIEIIEKACEIHANLKKRGTPIQEADILIAATSKKRGLILVSHDSDLQRVSEITLEDWLQAES